MEAIIIVLSLLLSAFFSGMEIAYVSANRIHIEIQKKQDDLLSKILIKLTQKPSKFITTMLIGNAVSLVVYGFYFGEWIMRWLFPQYVGGGYIPIRVTFIQMVITTGVILVTAEFLPKVFFKIYSKTLLKLGIIPSYIFYILFNPLTVLLIGITDFVMKYIFKSKTNESPLAFTKTELNYYISEQIDIVDNLEEVDNGLEIFRNALNFAKLKARDVMVPRTDILAIDVYETPKKLSSMFITSGYSKILVFNESIDNIIGYVYSFELFKRPKTIKSILMNIEYVPETMLIRNVLNVLIQKRKSIAVVLDEFGGTSGIITMEDIIEELFGNIQDEHDNEEFTEERLGDNEFRFSARLDVDYINKSYKINIPEDEAYETLGGFIVSIHGDIPSPEDVISTDDFEFIILEGSETKIDTVYLRVINKKTLKSF